MSALPLYRSANVQAALLFVFACLLYANTLGHDYALDDAIVITDNRLVQRGFGGIGELFAHDTFYGFFNDDSKASLVAGGRYRPLTPALFAVEVGLGAGPFLHHLFNLLWYGLLVAVVFGFVRHIARDRLPWWFAAGVAVLFAAHPLHTEVVANIKGRDEILALLGAVGGTWLILRAADRPDGRWYAPGVWLGAGLIFLGCLAKENALTWLAVVPAALLLFGRREGPGRTGHYLKYGLPVLVAVAAFLALRTAVIGTGFGEPVLEVLNNPFLELKNGRWTPMSTGTRLAVVMHTLWEYVRLLFVPVGLVHDYYPMAVPVKSWGQLTPWLGLLMHVGLVVYGWLVGRKRPYVALGILIYLATLSIVSNVLFSVGTNMSERFLFMPSLGWALAVVALLARASDNGKGWLAYLLPVVVAVFAVLTVLRNPVWADNFTLFTTDVERQPDSAKLRNAAAGARLERYQSFPAAQQERQLPLVRAAKKDLDAAIALHPGYKNAFLLRGNANLHLKAYDAAIADYDRALELDGGYLAARDNLALALTAAGRDAGEVKGDLQAAFGYLQRAEQLSPNNYETLRLLGVANGVAGRNEVAVDYFRRASEQRPQDAEAQWNYGIALYNAGRAAEAEAAFQRAEQLQPGIRASRSGG